MEEFCLWPEDPVPADQKGCTCCRLYRQGSRMVWGEGTPGAPVMIILDNPGAREDREGNPAVCTTRQTLQRAVREAGMTEDQLYVTYILKRRPVRKYDKEETRSICMQHLDQQLAAHRPELILCLGNVAVQSFFGEPDAEVKPLRGAWHEVRGIPTAAAYHPLAVRRRPNLLRLFQEDMDFVAAALRSRT
ncbi:uracil-DNA glycosylase [Sporosarcina trichiuri]|uniref:uracil-DNA glycosylase n=1 Tax=Sporosarcina trichiuri TaxID=3056445 RepID=UPI0025B4099C|nr:uracil-DNA glycosylase [Sporosarcina sp. 0.2-SM1T-5]WJY28941.1 uracil-DNA glycosylase [Sporosarcina sp. 0.2-SM1T-5]